MGKIKSLAGETVIYGVTTIVSRLLAWFLTPFYIRTLEIEAFGGATNIYSYVAVFLVFLTFGFETGYFRYVNQNNRLDLLRTLNAFIISLSVVFISLVFFFANHLQQSIGNQYLTSSIFKYGGIIVSLDAITSIPFADLRYSNRKMRYAGLRFFQVILNIFFNVFFLVICPYLLSNGYDFIETFFDPNNKLKYVFISNIASSGFIALYFLPVLIKSNGLFLSSLLKKLIPYSFPIMIVGLFGMLIQNIDKILMPQLLNNNALEQLAIYGANFKIGVLMALFIQSYRLAFEPFFFKEGKEQASNDLYAMILKVFVIFGVLIYTGVLLFLPIINKALTDDYLEGNIIIPFILMGQLFFGIYYSLSLWYKLTDKTNYGAYISGFGAFIVVILNIVLVPKIGYLGAAISSFICFFLMMVLSYLFGQKFYPIKYPVKSIFLYLISAVTVVYLANLIHLKNDIFLLGIKALIFVSYLGIIVYIERSNFSKFIR